jgi:hypothetical protein
MDPEQHVERPRESSEETGGEVVSETEVARAKDALHAAMTALGVMTENLRTFLLSRK